MKSSRRIKSEDKTSESKVLEILVPDMDTTCNICYAEFLDAEDLKIHVQQMHLTEQNKLHYCYFCSSLFAHMDDYALHLRDAHLSHIKCCEFCSRAFVDLENLRQHEGKHKKHKSMLSCSQCKTFFNTALEVENHELECHIDIEDGIFLHNVFPHLSSIINIKANMFLLSLGRESIYICAKCKYTSPDATEYITHLQNENCHSLVCNKCCNVYTNKIGLRKHFKRKNGCLDYMKFNDNICPKCHKNINRMSLQQHLKLCGVIKCSTCEITFSSMDELSDHQNKEHPLAISLQKCKFCHKEFIGTVALQRHIERTHNPDRFKYICRHCGQIYEHPKKLFAHFFTQHREIEPYTCKICNKTFRIRKNFTLHIKLEHKSIGHVEFDKDFHVIFTDKKPNTAAKKSNTVQIDNNESESGAADINFKNLNSDNNEVSDDVNKPILIIENGNGKKDPKDRAAPAKKSAVIQNISENLNDSKFVNKNFPTLTDTESNHAETDTKKSPIKRKRKHKTKQNVTKLSKNVLMYEISDSDDEPLLNLKKKFKTKQTQWNRKQRDNIFKRKKENFTCGFCKKYCYTYQNYHHHISLHNKNKAKKCIKCLQVFKTEKALNCHIQQEHSSSKLIETLQTILEKRKRNDGKQDTISTTYKFLKTIKKVGRNTSDAVVTIKPVNEKLPVQKFIENFTPEASEMGKSHFNIEACVTMKPLDKDVPKKPLIKMIKFKPEPVNSNNGSIKLSMPVKFKESPPEESKINIKLVQQSVEKVTLNFGDNKENNFDEHNEEYLDVNDDYEDATEQFDNDAIIPDVAEEVMLEESQEIPKIEQVPHKIVIPNLPKEYKQIRIAHLLPEAPYYKIVKVDEMLKNQQEEEKPKIQEKEKDKEVILPGGTKLINVNPLAHLLKDKSLDTILKPQKTKHYKSKNTNFERAIANALLKLENSSNAPKKNTKKKHEVEQ